MPTATPDPDPLPRTLASADHPNDCTPECTDCAEVEAMDDIRDSLDCDQPRPRRATARDGARPVEGNIYVACGRCDRCR